MFKKKKGSKEKTNKVSVRHCSSSIRLPRQDEDTEYICNIFMHIEMGLKTCKFMSICRRVTGELSCKLLLIIVNTYL